MSSETEPVVEAALAIFGDNIPLRQLAERFGTSVSDALAQYGTRWFCNRAIDLWKSARARVSRSGRTPTTPRAQAAIRITEHGAAKERRNLREAYENLAARSMTEDERDHDYEGYVHMLRGLQSGDIDILRAIHAKSKRGEKALFTGRSIFLPLRDLNRCVDATITNIMDSIDRLEASRLVTVRIESRSIQIESKVRQPGEWCIEGSSDDHQGYFSVLLKPRGTVLLEHIADLDPLDEATEN